VLNLSEFSIGFNTPTSTSKTIEVAWRFAGSGGMVITVGNEKGESEWQPLFNATWISAYAEEDEYFWFGSYYKLSVDDVAIVASSRVYRKSLASLWLFDAVLSGQWVEGMKVDIKTLDFCLKHARNEALPPKPKTVDDYVLDNMYSFRQNKSKILLDLVAVGNLEPSLQNMVCFGVTRSDDIPEGNTNIFRPDLLELFPNLVEVELWVYRYYRLNLLSLLSVLADSTFPPSFQVLKIKDMEHWWLKKAFHSIPNVKEQFAAKNWEIENAGKYGMWVIIKPMN
ncbi:MAG: hypothetical protein GY766_15625, partial [Herbaspirillum sp.]|uniref:hypothetical protein n=1 Tax=Herbaspirillum sp. TaxID=1890675 RepID=UPI0025873E58